MLDACREGRVNIHADSEHMRPFQCATTSGPHANSKARAGFSKQPPTGAARGGDVLNGNSQGDDDRPSSSCQDSSFSSTSAAHARLTPVPCATACTFRVSVKGHREKKTGLDQFLQPN